MRIAASPDACAQWLIRNDWSSHRLGSPVDWSHAMKCNLEIVFNTGVPKLLLWGAEHFSFFNQSFADLGFGLQPDMLGLPFDATCPAIWALIEPQVNSALSGLSLIQREIEVPHHGDSGQSHLRAHFSPIFGVEPEPQGVVIEVHDVTPYRRLSERLLIENDNLQQIFAEAPILMAYGVGPEFRVRFANSAFRNLFAGRLREGQPFREVASKAGAGSFQKAVAHVFATGQSAFVEAEKLEIMRTPARTATHYIDFNYRPIRDTGGSVAGVLCTGFDVTEQVSTKKESERLRHHVLHFSRINAMGTMAMTLAHELNQPLAAATNYASAARQLVASADDRERTLGRSAIESAISQIGRAGEIIRRMRSVVRSGEADRQPVVLADAVDRAWLLLGLDDDTMRMTKVFANDVGRVLADGVQLEQVMTNLFRNAVEASRDSARKEIVVTARTLAGGRVGVSVRDYGKGISSEDIINLFSREERAESGGLGVGLSLSWTLIDANRGRLRAAKAEGGGAVFSFDLDAA